MVRCLAPFLLAMEPIADCPMAGVSRFRKCFGGGIRQSGALAASADFALTHNFDKLRETHAMAKRLADGLEALGVRLLVKAETSMVRISSSRPGLAKLRS